MRIVTSDKITETVRDLLIRANYVLPECIRSKLAEEYNHEEEGTAKTMLGILCENARTAVDEHIPICQDTGMAVVFIELGQDVHIEGKLLKDAVNDGVRMAYDQGYLRKSVVGDPLKRVNTGDNTPAVLYIDLVEGESVRIRVMPKGFGSENMSRIKMFNPTATKQEIIDFIVETVKIAGGNPCPPIILGIGVGGTFDSCAVAAKKALLRDIGDYHPKYSDWEKEILDAVNRSGVGVQGLGKGVTALWAAVETNATHIAGLPIAVNISCHATRHQEAIL